MSTVKISELALIGQLNANTSNTLFVAVDIPSGVTGKFTGHTLAQGLYSNEILNVGANPVTYPGVVAQFSGNSTSTTTYLQVNFQNFTSNGSTDYVASTSDSTNANSFIDMGISGKDYSDPVYYSAFKPYDGYVYVGGPTATSYSGNLILGTSSTRANIVFMVGGTMSENVVGYITNNGYNLLSNVSVRGALSTTTGLKFADGSTQNTASNPAVFSQASYTQANTATTIGQAAFAKANNALANTTGTFAGDLTLIGNLIAFGTQSTTGAITTGNLIVNGTTNISGSVNPQKGFIYTPTQYPGAQTAITIDFANNSVIRANTSTGCTVSFVNYTLGKEVVLWLTNTAGTNQTFTHGVNALNSTVNSTTYNIPGTSTIMARYFSFGNDLANTFVAVVHA